MYYPLISSMNKASAPAGIITAGLVMNLDVGNIACYPGTGTLLTDLTGNSNNGTVTGGATYSSSNGGFFTFDGSNDYINIAVKPQQNAMTLECWAKMVNLSGKQLFFVDSGAGYVEMGTSNTKPFCGFYDTGAKSATGDTSISTGTWYHFVGRYKNGEVPKIYLNGVLDKEGTTANGAIGSVATNFQILRNGGVYFNVSLSVARIYNTALSSSDILQNFNAIKSRYGY